MKKFNSFFSGSYKDGRLRTLVLLLCLFTGSFSLDGQQTYTWTGAALDNNWDTPANWNPNLASEGITANDILVFSINGSLTFTGVEDRTINGLVVTNSTNLVLQPQNSATTLTIAINYDIYKSGTLQVDLGSSLTIGTNMSLIITDASIIGTLTVNSSKTFRATASSTEIDGTMTVNDGGIFINGQTSTTTTSENGKLIFKSGSTYQHTANNITTIPNATWESGSTCEITGWKNTPGLSSSFNQPFSNFTWNCSGQTADVSFGSYLTALTGNLSIASTGSMGKKVTISSNTNISGNLNVSGTGKLSIAAGAGVTVNGDLASNGNLTIESLLASNGSLIVNGTSTGNITYNRQLLTGDNGNYHLISLPVTSTTTTDGDVSLVWTYSEVTGDWSSQSNFYGISSGQGFSMDKDTLADMISFTGPIKTSEFSVKATSPYEDSVTVETVDYDSRELVTGRNYGGGGWNLLGNPFTSALNISKFIDANDGTNNYDGSFDPNYTSVYIYDPDDGVEGSYHYSTSGYVQAGQGFMVMAMSDSVFFSFTPGTDGMQGHATTTLMYKSAEVDDTWPGLTLEVAYGSGESTTDIIYNDEMTLGLDPRYDIGQLSSKPAVEIYTALVKDNGVNFDRQALPIVDCDKSVVAIGVDSKDGGAVTFSAVTVPLTGYQYYLEDRTAGTFTELGVETYTVTLPANTFGTGRFYLHTKDGVPTGTDPDISDPLDMRIWAYGDAIMIQGAVSSKATCTVYNMQGNMIHNQRLTDETMNTVPMKSSAKGVYIVVVNDEGKIHRQKVVMF